MKVLTIGTATRDILVTSPLFRVVNDPEHLKKMGFPTGEAQCFALGGKVEVEKPILTVGGGAANSAVTFARQGFETSALIKIGRDRNGEGVIKDLEKDKVRPVVVFDKEAGTSYSIILLSPGGERTILNYRGASEYLEYRELSPKDLKVDVAYIAPGAIQDSVMIKIVGSLKKNKALIAMNPSKHYIELGAKKLKPIFDNLDIIILNREEGSFLTGVKYEDERGILKKFDELVGGLAVMTDGHNGVMVSDGRQIYRAGIYKEKRIADRTGAGDSFGSGFTAGILRSLKLKNKSEKLWFSSKGGSAFGRKIQNFTKEDIIYAIRLGSANATSNVEEIGAQSGILTKKEFETQARWKKLKIETVEMR